MYKYEGFRLFGVGDSDGVLTGSDYGDYTLVVADSIESAYEILLPKYFENWKENLQNNKRNAHFNAEGKALNGCAEMFLEDKEKGYYNMTDKELLDVYKEKFPISHVEDLQTNVWDGSNS